MQALYENSDGSYSVGVVVGRGLAVDAWGDHGIGRYPTVQVRFEDTEQDGGVQRVETLFADDRSLTIGVLFGSMVSALSKHA